MKVFFDFFPVVLFFLAFKIWGMLPATGVIMAATAIQVLIHWIRHRRLETMHLLSLGLIVMFGGATLLFHDKRPLQWKPSILYWIMSIAFISSQFVGPKKTVMERLLAKSMELPARIWTRLNIGWAIFFAVLGGVNLFVAYNFSENVWVNFKLFGLLGLTFAFAIAQGLYLNKYLVPKKEGAEK